MQMSIEEIFDFIMEYLAPAYIVFEDVDLIGFDRNMGSNPVIGRLLALFDGIEEIDRAVVFCSTTNRAEALDAAFTRPCRVDRKFHLDYLTLEDMNSLFKLLLDVPVPDILKDKKLTGSHIQEIADTAKLMAKKNGGNIKVHVDEAVSIVLEHFQLSTGAALGFSSSGPARGYDVAMATTQVEECEPKESNKRDPWTRRGL
jgi:SpoVK/Ycf46/Vps4 family AAA+-type ATPase